MFNWKITTNPTYCSGFGITCINIWHTFVKAIVRHVIIALPNFEMLYKNTIPLNEGKKI